MMEVGSRSLFEDIGKSDTKAGEDLGGKDIVGFFAQLHGAAVFLLR